MNVGDRLEFSAECFDLAPISRFGTVKRIEHGEVLIELDGGESVTLNEGDLQPIHPELPPE